jgi:hypothetical protein
MSKNRLVLVYIATFSPCIYESEYGIISVHSTYESAKESLEEHKENYIDEFGEPESWTKWEVRECVIHD